MEGRSLIISYCQNKEGFIDTEKQKLSRIIMKHEIESDHPTPVLLEKLEFKRDRFINLAAEIAETFPTEDQKLYYRPSVKSKNPGGTLYSAFEGIKFNFRKSGLLKKTGPREVVDFTPTENDLSAIEWLKTHRDAVDIDIVAKWDSTFHFRKNLLKSKTNCISVDDYCQQFLVLDSVIGADLLQSDFEREFPGKNDKDAIILSLLPYIIAADRIRKRKINKKSDNSEEIGEEIAGSSNGKYLTSFLERRSSLFIHAQSSAEIAVGVNKYKAHLKATKLKFQPVPLFVGPLSSVDSSYVILNNIRYKTDKPLHAKNLACQIYWALDCHYPSQAKSI
ncbi:hypothetical protein HCN44_003491 [Aphidius gifuensis]|uniref:Uncharacterized protein n=1 Tax=Aphidius gifuensis TaxID=684658 RepID=A0A834XID3_APHGI|nr:hypothetical protein HCN44_003491 [Aphidius gifuensis]